MFTEPLLSNALAIRVTVLLPDSLTDALCTKARATGKKERERERILTDNFSFYVFDTQMYFQIFTQS
jgi:hypothetical protein